MKGDADRLGRAVAGVFPTANRRRNALCFGGRRLVQARLLEVHGEARHRSTDASYDVGYELTTQLLIDVQSGRPIAPIQSHLKTVEGYLTTAQTSVPDAHRLEQVAALMPGRKLLCGIIIVGTSRVISS